MDKLDFHPPLVQNPMTPISAQVPSQDQVAYLKTQSRQPTKDADPGIQPGASRRIFPSIPESHCPIDFYAFICLGFGRKGIPEESFLNEKPSSVKIL